MKRGRKLERVKSLSLSSNVINKALRKILFFMKGQISMLGLSTKQAEILISMTVYSAETAVVDSEKIFLQWKVALFLVRYFFFFLPLSGCLQWH